MNKACFLLLIILFIRTCFHSCYLWLSSRLSHTNIYSNSLSTRCSYFWTHLATSLCIWMNISSSFSLHLILFVSIYISLVTQWINYQLLTQPLHCQFWNAETLTVKPVLDWRLLSSDQQTFNVDLSDVEQHAYVLLFVEKGEWYSQGYSYSPLSMAPRSRKHMVVSVTTAR